MSLIQRNNNEYIHNHNRSGSDRDIPQLTSRKSKSPNLSGSRHNKHKNRLSKHLNHKHSHSRHSPHRGPVTVMKQRSNSPHFELIPRSLEQSGINPTALILDEQMVNIVNKQSHQLNP